MKNWIIIVPLLYIGCISSAFKEYKTTSYRKYNAFNYFILSPEDKVKEGKIKVIEEQRQKGIDHVYAVYSTRLFIISECALEKSLIHKINYKSYRLINSENEKRKLEAEAERRRQESEDEKRKLDAESERRKSGNENEGRNLGKQDESRGLGALKEEQYPHINCWNSRGGFNLLSFDVLKKPNGEVKILNEGLNDNDIYIIYKNQVTRNQKGVVNPYKSTLYPPQLFEVY